ncbi:MULTISPECIES: 50S ribosomal protein L4 [Clostridium]|jgi:large subunit ribosomal protein L4|uniref:Large ribosomal subunit protein uL4 n=1 Tax=Clostridium saccharoperbutylacetonicum N1-4(HMT) TaxID=931276 RepID=M1MQV3_9CLOT|nr:MULTISPECIES: 50S ribosomal protein L4 [Clostridium]AGF54007.1 50S ribosomal protein L4 [Clostridium saccharoperbutylacetonicum N1-4(HMT)]AQR92911.1 50S ribosomal protein L4 [Clostridium saccharoperbutylacetonicum]NRT59480.1 large subunit ribosomal protein L4 [Clostridium saccharoperbutylacetonicum]NSB28672.1 large subunit ribosomal protein L4 [Clostridium saccharoperbutylacetonicum]NSB34322.1 large subunit ribosomal protein L4 [Clostridium saccharoperbutylacetonicum]
MPTVGVFNKEGNKVADMELNESVFAAEINEYALHQVVVALLANKRQGTQSTKTRSEVRGGGIKPWRQKGTGRARQGSIRAPQWIKGGIVFAPKPRDYRVSVPKSMRKVAMKSALTSKVQDNQMIVLDSLNFEAPKTKNMVEMLKALEAKKALIITAESNEVVYKSARNIQGINIIPANNINVYDLLKYEKLIITKDAVSKIEEVYA